MIGRPEFSVEPWGITAAGADLETLAQSETLFSLSNGHLGWRGNLDEGEPAGMPGSYLNGFFEERPLPHAEPGYGYPETGETLINTVNGKLIRLLVDDEPLDLRTGEARRHERRLDFRQGMLRRDLEWTSPSGRTVRVRSRRIVSLTERSVAAVVYEVEAVDRACRVVVQSELLANEPLPVEYDDPRIAAALKRPLTAVAASASGARADLVHRTSGSRLTVATAMDHLIEGTVGFGVETVVEPDLARTTVTADLEPGQSLRIVKFVAYCWSADRGPAALRDEADANLAVALRSGWDGLVEQQRGVLDDFWAHSDVAIDGDPELQQAVRFSLFSVLQASLRAEGTALPAKGLTGPGYDGHSFWETEIFVLPVLVSTLPDAARDALRWRHSTLGIARRRAQELRLRGAAFPWRTIDGRECSGYWPAGTAAFHVNADIAHACLRYLRATGDDEFEAGIGLELLIETARLWQTLGHFDAHGRFHIDGVTGPDEYSAIVDDNVYTNLMAAQNLRGAAEFAERHPAGAAKLGVTPEEIAGWRTAAGAMSIPYDEERRVHPQSHEFTDHDRWDFEGTPPEEYPLMEHFPYFELYRKQVVKQADLVLALVLRSREFTDAEKLRDFAYYEALTVRDSSLSAAVQAIVAAEVGALQLAADYLAETALIDLGDLHGSTGSGLHMASLAGIWTTLVAGFGGMRHDEDGLRFAPRLPENLDRLSFGIRVDGGSLRVEVGRDETAYTWTGAAALRFAHGREQVEVEPGASTRLPNPPVPVPVIEITQPRGRSPRTVIHSNGG
ncbi:glycoside hydrolase family 65 protein [Naasia sp. SYSU D00057]|uniref:glycoside hydrolase family 65 protein n=1 Tax=Naasia sp. SYSU D00057 TaxID=2817380 RepID=UPI001FEE1D45|nr:glycosyl hydrolase family 65 protein [Naasia sp. SYSU D00057]